MNRLISILAILASLTFKLQSQTLKIKADSLIEFSKKNIGVNYKYGECNPKTGFDCSGFVFYTFKHFKIEVPRSSMQYEKLGRVVSIDSAKKGDIIVFTGTNHLQKRAGHVGIIVSEQGGQLQFIHSSSSEKQSGVKITDYYQSPGYIKRFIKVIRLENIIQS